MNINDFGFIRVAAASPKLKVADCGYNTAEIKSVIERAGKENVQILCFPRTLYHSLQLWRPLLSDGIAAEST